jgi:hypothetical protein
MLLKSLQLFESPAHRRIVDTQMRGDFVEPIAMLVRNRRGEVSLIWITISRSNCASVTIGIDRFFDPANQGTG